VFVGRVVRRAYCAVDGRQRRPKRSESFFQWFRQDPRVTFSDQLLIDHDASLSRQALAQRTAAYLRIICPVSLSEC